MRIPEAFAAGVIQDQGAEGERWLAALPAQFQHYCLLWGLEPDGDPGHGYLGLVFPVRMGESRAVLKLTRVDEETRDEAAALRLWDGRGAARLLEAAEGVLLLERLEAARSLAQEPIGAAVSVAARLLRRLSVPAPPSFLEMAAYARELEALAARRWQRFQPFPREWLQLPEGRNSLLVNQDLHFENVLAGSREPWLVIDPKPLRGDPEFAVAPLLWNRFEEGAPLARFDQIVREAELDRALALRWTLFRVLEYWLWALNLGLTEDGPRCRALAEELLQG